MALLMKSDTKVDGNSLVEKNTQLTADKGPFSDPVYKKLATLNGEVNRMDKEELKEKLKKLHLDTRGQKDVLKKRLKNYMKRKQLGSIPGSTGVKRYEYLLVIDFEATCEKDVQQFNHEIIEFPVVLVDVSSQTIIDEFHSYVRPTVNKRLSKFCTELTGITQETVDAAPCFPEVLNMMEAWMAGHPFGKGRKIAVVTDGPCDMSRFMYLQCRTSRLPFPRWARKWINIRKSYCTAYRAERANITTMLENLGLAFEGTLHSGIDDSRNIARIVVQMLRDECNLRTNERLYPHQVSIVADAVNKAKHGQDAALYCCPEVVGIGANDRNESTDDDEEENEKQPSGAAANKPDESKFKIEDEANIYEIKRSSDGTTTGEVESCQSKISSGSILYTDEFASFPRVSSVGVSSDENCGRSSRKESVSVTTDILSRLSFEN